MKRLFRKLAYADKVRKFRVLHGHDARDDEGFMALAGDFGEQGIDEWAADDRDVSDLDGFLAGLHGRGSVPRPWLLAITASA